MSFEELSPQIRQNIRAFAQTFNPSNESSTIEQFAIFCHQLCVDWEEHMLNHDTRDIDNMLNELNIVKNLAMDLAHEALEEELDFLIAICFCEIYED